MSTKTALILSGGGSRGAYQVGVWQALRELGIEIDIVTGASVGALNAAMVAQADFDVAKRLWEEMETHRVFDIPKDSSPLNYVKEMAINQGAGTSGLKALMDEYIDEDKIRTSNISLGITAFSLKTLKGQQLFVSEIPKGQLKDYIMASASAFPILHPYRIDGEAFIDGGYEDVLPVDLALKEKPTHVITVNLRGYGVLNKEILEKCPNLKWIESPWDLGFQFKFDTSNSKRLLRLGYLDALKTYEVLEGNYFTFSKGAFDKNMTKYADICAKIFQLNPLTIYTKEVFLSCLKTAMEKSLISFNPDLNPISKFADKGFSLNTFTHSLPKLRDLISYENLTYLIAKSIKEKQEDSPFLKRTALKLFHDEILAAKFLIKFDLI